MTPVVAISKPPIVAATTNIIIFGSDSCSPSFLGGSEVDSVSGKVVGCTPVDSEKNMQH